MNPTSLRSTPILLVALLVSAATAFAQTPTTGSISGTVRDLVGAPVFEAEVTVVDGATGTSFGTITDRTGRFDVGYLLAGPYSVLVEALNFTPVLVQDVPVRPDRIVSMAVELSPSAPPVSRVDTVAFDRSIVGGSQPGLGHWFSGRELARYTDRSRLVSGIAALETGSDEILGLHGLPGRMTAVGIDGLPFRSAAHPHLAGDPLAALILTRGVLSNAEFLLNEAEIEWAGAGGGYLSGQTRRETSGAALTGFGDWAGGWSSRFFDGTTPGATSLRGGLFAGVALVPDTAHLSVGVEARREQRPVLPALPAGTAAPEIVAAAGDPWGVDLAPYAAAQLEEVQAVDGFARLDWKIGEENFVSLRANAAFLPASSDTRGLSLHPGEASGAEGTDVSVAGSVRSRITDRFLFELRAGAETSSRTYRSEEYGPLGAPSPPRLPGTILVGDGLAVGTHGALPGEFVRTTLHAVPAVHFRDQEHRLKGGLQLMVPLLDYRYAYGRAGEYFFSDAVDLSDALGAFVQNVGPAPAAEFAVPRFGAFVQDIWSAAPGLLLTLGVRADIESLPTDDVALNTDWLDLTGVSNASMPSSLTRVGTRFGFAWDLAERGRTLLQGSVGLSYEDSDPGVLAEAITLAGSQRTRRALGDVGRWPTAPDSARAPVVGPRMAILGPDYQAPRTAKGSIGLTQLVGPRTALHLAGVFRRTEFLTRRDDLNRLPSASGTDQFGRPVYGTLRNVGAVLGSEPGTGRRFRNFDHVWALNSDGWSEYRGLTIGLEHRAGALDLQASYTVSRTEDNLVGAGNPRPDARMNPFPEGLSDGDWSEGRSDFDVPHRFSAAAALELPVLEGLTLAGVYRFRSGSAFTPGFRDGVDANGDGSFRNDPAFVSSSTEIQALATGWSCLTEQVGGFAERNACRGPGLHNLDLSLAIGFARVGGGVAELVFDALNVLEPEDGIRDRALFLVDADQAVARDEVTGDVQVPLRVNSGFGEILVPRTFGRLIRVGVRIRN